MKTWNFLCSTLALAASALPARAVVVVEVPKAGEYTAWVADRGGKILAGPSPFEGTKAVLDTGTEKSSGAWSVVVEDAKTGNAAEMKVPAGESPRLTLKADDFDRIGLVTVSVSDKDGKAPTYAAVTLIDGAKKAHAAALRPSDAGRATFRNVASGDGSVRVQQGDAQNQQTVTVRLPLEREAPVLPLTVDVSLPDGMNTQDAAPAGGPGAPAGEAGDGQGAAGERDTAPSRNPWPGFLVALVILAGGGYLAYRFMRGQGVTAQSALSRVGIQLPDDQPDAAIVEPEAIEPVDPTVCPFCGGKKDATGSCPNCAVGAAASGAAPAASAFSAAPAGGRRLVAVSGPRAGHVFPILDTLGIGRETGQDVAITDDPSLSRHHAVIETAGGPATIADQGSSNGTWVNGQRVERQALRPGDEITLGASRFRYEE